MSTKTDDKYRAEQPVFAGPYRVLFRGGFVGRRGQYHVGPAELVYDQTIDGVLRRQMVSTLLSGADAVKWAHRLNKAYAAGLVAAGGVA